MTGAEHRGKFVTMPAVGLSGSLLPWCGGDGGWTSGDKAEIATAQASLLDMYREIDQADRR